MAKQYDIYVSRGDTMPQTFTLKLNGTAIDVTGATITFYMLDAQVWRGVDFDAPLSEMDNSNDSTSDLLTVKAATVTLVTPSSGIVKITPTSTWYARGGTYVYQFKVVYADGTIEHVPNLNPTLEAPRLIVGAGLSSLS